MTKDGFKKTIRSSESKMGKKNQGWTTEVAKHKEHY
jgi:hypothetical protein